jgi:hypothetical protein
MALVRDIARELRTAGTYTTFTAHAMSPADVKSLLT